MDTTYPTRNWAHRHSLMVQGTTSDAGKSILVTALCRILARAGFQVAPFKPQNMALNSAVTCEGGEIGRAQAVQAQACFLEPSIDMNPVLLKPNTDVGAQVIVNGKAIGNMAAQHYHQHKPKLLEAVLAAHQRLSDRYQAVIIEGAGSPAEINLRDRDIANMGFAEQADCPVILIADIDRGGVFAHLVGTLELLSASEQDRVIGFVINRFRGDIALLQSGLDWLEQRTGKPVLGVIPYLTDLHIEAEDAIAPTSSTTERPLKVVVPVLPRISNHTDFDALKLHPQVDLQFIKSPGRFRGADLIILPGSKNVRHDLNWLRESGWESLIHQHLRYQGKLIGICGGYQMLGQEIQDPLGIESRPGNSSGLGFLDITTKLAPEKALINVTGHWIGHQIPVTGYEIHAGVTEGSALENPLFDLGDHTDGAMSHDQKILGTYIHGLFDQKETLCHLLEWAGLRADTEFDYRTHREQEIERLADAVEQAIGLETIKQLVGL